MHLRVQVSTLGAERPPAGAPIYVQARDTTFEDAPAPTIASASGKVRPEGGELLDTIDLDVATLPDSSIVWVRVDVDQDGRVSPGDCLTSASCPIGRQEGGEIAVVVRRVWARARLLRRGVGAPWAG